MVVVLIINESFQTRKGMSSNKICLHSERKNGAVCHPKQVIWLPSWYVGNPQTIWWLKWLIITSVLNSDHQSPTDSSSIESHTISQKIPHVKHKLQQRYFWTHCYRASVRFFLGGGEGCKPALTFLHWRSHPLLRSTRRMSRDAVTSICRKAICVAWVAILQTMRFSRTSYSSIILCNHVGRKGGECGRPKSNQHLKP